MMEAPCIAGDGVAPSTLPQVVHSLIELLVQLPE
jgi:hypothetical protein